VHRPTSYRIRLGGRCSQASSIPPLVHFMMPYVVILIPRPHFHDSKRLSIWYMLRYIGRDQFRNRHSVYTPRYCSMRGDADRVSRAAVVDIYFFFCLFIFSKGSRHISTLTAVKLGCWTEIKRCVPGRHLNSVTFHWRGRFCSVC